MDQHMKQKSTNFPAVIRKVRKIIFKADLHYIVDTDKQIWRYQQQPEAA